MKKGIIAAISITIGAAVGYIGGKALQGRETKNVKQKVDKFKSYYNVLNQWLIAKQDNKSFDNYFIQNGYHKIAIYGMGELGHRLYDELKNTDVEVKYAIDKNANGIYSDIEVLEMEDDLMPVDAVIVTAVFAFEEIKEELSQRLDCPVITLENLICEL